MKTRRQNKTELMELVETHNLANSLRRLQEGRETDAWKRALYHATMLAMPWSKPFAEKLRMALELP